MWVVLLDGVGGCASPRRGARFFEAARPQRARIPSWDVAAKGPYPVLGRRNDAAAAPQPPIRAGEARQGRAPKLR